jgi:mannose-6-phosphate isomerase-like protein (cupin superfamily)
VLPALPSGDIVHAQGTLRSTARTAFLDRATEFFYVIEGEGQLWRQFDHEAEVVSLKGGGCASIPPGVHYQFQCTSPPLSFLVVTAPRWDIAYWHELSEGDWRPGGTENRRRPRVGPITACQRQDLPAAPDYLAPDGSEIRLLLDCPDGGVAHCRLHAGATSSAVRHKTVDEIWYVLGGEGEIWRAQLGEEEVVALRAGTCLTIPVGVSFQFRASGSSRLEILIGTFPRWTGAEEAVPVSGHWQP